MTLNALEEQLGLTPTQISLTSHLGAILAVPLQREDTGEIIGVLSLDSPYSLEDSGLRKSSVQKEVLQIATTIVEALDRRD